MVATKRNWRENEIPSSTETGTRRDAEPSDRQDTEAPSDSRPEQRRSKKSIARHTEEVESDLDVASTDDLSSPDSEVVESEYSSDDECLLDKKYFLHNLDQ